MSVSLSINHTAKTDCAASVEAGPDSDEFCVMAARLRAAFNVPDAALSVEVTAAAYHYKTCMSVTAAAFCPFPDVA